LGPVITAGTVHVAQNASLTSLSALSITVVSTSLIVSNNNTLTNLDGLGSVTALSDTCEVSANLELSDIDGLSNLTSVGVQFSITNNPKLCALPLWVSNVTAPSTSFVGNGIDPSCP
jgi:hypothetical protein